MCHGYSPKKTKGKKKRIVKKKKRIVVKLGCDDGCTAINIIKFIEFKKCWFQSTELDDLYYPFEL